MDDSLARLVAGEIDIATIVNPPEGRDLFHTPLVDESFVCVMRAGHPLTKGRLTPARLVEYPHVAVTAHVGAAGLVDRAFAERGLRRRITVSVAGFATTFALLAESDLVSIVPGRIARQQAVRFGLAVQAGADARRRLHPEPPLAPAHRKRRRPPLGARAAPRRGPRGRWSSTASITVSRNINWTEGAPPPTVGA